MRRSPEQAMISTSRFHGHAITAGFSVAVVLGLLFGVGCASAPGPAPPARLDFPAPDVGPGRPDLDKAQRQQIDKGWQALRAGDTAAARAAVARGAPSSASELLILQAEIVAGSENPVAELESLTDSHSRYAAAWLTLSVAAENEGEESIALSASIRGAELWPEERWLDRSMELYQRWVGDRIDSARAFYDDGDNESALEALEPALFLDPDSRDAVILKARVLIALEQPDRAEAALARLPRDTEVVRLSGNIAEARGDLSAAFRIYTSLPDDPKAVLLAVAIAEGEDDWLSAMNLYESLPEDRPEKGPGLRRAKLRWRISVMPEYVQEAFSSPELTRSQLAVIVVSSSPQVETLAGGQVPLLSDVMTLPSRDEILTATRLGLIESDRFLDRFHPQRPATANEVRYAVDGLAHLLELQSPRWCGGEIEGEPCIEIVEPVSGPHVSGIVIELATRKGEAQ